MFPKVGQQVRLRKEFVENHIKWFGRDTFFYGNAWEISYIVKAVDPLSGLHYITLDGPLFRPQNPSDPTINALFVNTDGRFCDGTMVFEDAGNIIVEFVVKAGDFWPRHCNRKQPDDICKLCGGVGKVDRMACICSKCGNVIWGC